MTYKTYTEEEQEFNALVMRSLLVVPDPITPEMITQYFTSFTNSNSKVMKRTYCTQFATHTDAKQNTLADVYDWVKKMIRSAA
jgi:hypothetical protein